MTWKMEQVKKNGNKFAGLRCGFVELRAEKPADWGTHSYAQLNPKL